MAKSVIACLLLCTLTVMAQGVFVNPFIITIPFDDGPKNFIVDTGGGASVFDRHSFSRYRVEGHDTAYSLTGHTSLELISVEFDLAHIHIRQKVFRADLGIVSKRAGVRIDGVIGQDVLSHFNGVTFDYRKHGVFFH